MKTLFGSGINADSLFASMGNWAGTLYDQVDCSAFVWNVYQEAGLDYDYAQVGFTAGFQANTKFEEIDESELEDGDVALFPAAGHMGLYIMNPPVAGENLFGATYSAGVRYEEPGEWIDDDPAPDDEVQVKYYRWCPIV